MQNIQVMENSEQFKLLGNTDLRQRATEIITNVINPYLKKPFSSVDVYEYAHKTQMEEQFVISNTMTEATEKIKGKYGKVQQVMNRCVGYLVYGKSPEEAQEIVDKYNNMKGAKDLITEQLNKFANLDATIINKDYDAMCEEFIKNPADYAFGWQMQSAIQNQGLKLNPASEKLYNSMKGSIEALSQYNNAMDIVKNPMSLVIPYFPGSAEILNANSVEIMNLINSDPELSEVFKDVNIIDSIAKLSISYGQKEIHLAEMEAKKKLVDAGVIDAKFNLNKAFTIGEGDKRVDITYKEAIEYTKQGVTVGARELTNDEKAALQEDLTKGCCKYSSIEKQIEAGDATLNKVKSEKVVSDYLDKMVDLSKRINKTNYIFSQDTKQFKTMRDSLSAYVKKYQAEKAKIEKATSGMSEKEKKEYTYDKIQEFLDKTKDERTTVQANSRKYAEMKTKKNKEELDKTKKVKARSQERLDLAKELRDLRMGKLVVDEVVEEKQKMDPEKIMDTINGKNKNNEVKITKDLSKEKELEKEKVNSNNQ